MIAYLILGALVLLALWLGSQSMRSPDPAQVARWIRVLAIGLGVFGAIMFLAGVRIFGVLLVVLAALIYGLPRTIRSGDGGLGGLIRAGRNSRIPTKYLNTSLDREKGVIDGVVIAGQFAGRQLGNLDLDALLALRSECLANDPDSVPMIEAYIDQMHGTAWRQGSGPA
ncbi:MAG: hypothetical protein ACREEE_09490 [Dongiaceae bacterium]